MLYTKSYTILEDFSKCIGITSPLCILKMISITENYNQLLSIIKKNPQTKFWIATNDTSKESVIKANQLGIKNIINLPIDETLIHEYFNKTSHTNTENKYERSVDISGLKVAIVDDNEMNINLLSEVLSEMGLNIHSFIHPEEIIKYLECGKYDLFLLDILMPNISGFELANIIKQNKLNSGTPIVFISALSDFDTKSCSYEIGAYTYIEKPFNIELVKSQIYNILKSQIQTKKLNKQKENFVAMLTHDLKSPINAEINALELLITNKFGKITKCQKEIITTILSSAKYMKHMTDQILSFYKCQNSYIKLKKENVEFKSVVLESISAMKFLLDEKRQTIQFNSEIDKEMAFIDIIEIKRVLHNLISNAIEYSPEGSFIKIELSCDEKYFNFLINDNGYGIDTNNLSNIFDEYISLAKQQKKVGFGLGLNICKKIITAHGGNIFIESRLQQGTTIKFTIPR